jgi:DNA-binding CsgD family transcriptional regulator/PAS domain-containing protein
VTLAGRSRWERQTELDQRAEPSLAFDEAGELILANAAARAALGLPFAEPPEPDATSTPGGELQGGLPVDTLRAGWQVRGEFELTIDGHTALVRIASRPPLDDGTFVMALESPADGARPPRRFQRDGDVFEAVFEIVPAALLLLTDDRRMIAASASARRLFGLPRLDVSRTRLDYLVAGASTAELDGLWMRLRGDGELAATLPFRTSAGIRTLALYARANAVPGRHVAALTRGPSPNLGPGDRPPARPAIVRLSAREREILAGLAAGERTEQIADRLVLSADTVRTHVRNAMRKLDARSRVHAVVLALRAHEIDL